LAHSSLYYRLCDESEENVVLMGRIDRLYTKWPFLGSRRLSVYLGRQGYQANRKRVQRLMRLMGLKAIYPRRSLSRAAAHHKHYPYLLRGTEVIDSCINKATVRA
jgi:putative transposase